MIVCLHSRFKASCLLMVAGTAYFADLQCVLCLHIVIIVPLSEVWLMQLSPRVVGFWKCVLDYSRTSREPDLQSYYPPLPVSRVHCSNKTCVADPFLLLFSNQCVRDYLIWMPMEF